jgi:glycosyltransferase involved in cell wall biosynthesis
MGRPVVTADAGAYRELGLDGTAGWLFRAGDASSLTAALEEAAADPADAARRGRTALELAETLRWPDIAGRIATLVGRPP